jgi:predicted membrane-bound spermidine synthase
MAAEPADRRVSTMLFVALGLVTLATLAFEILLTRIFSLTMWYHFAFMAISMAMFGLTAGALIVFLKPGGWADERLESELGWSALLCSVGMVLCVITHIRSPFRDPAAGVFSLGYTFAAAALPFVYSGTFVSLALTRFPTQVGALYAVDLVGAALGCLVVLLALRVLDGISAVMACAAAPALAGAILLTGARRLLALAVVLGLAGATAWGALHLLSNEVSAYPVRLAKGIAQESPTYERWNSFSRIAVSRESPRQTSLVAWSLSASYPRPVDVASRWLLIDAWAGTPLIGFDGNLETVDYLRYDLTNFAHHLRRNGSVCIIGSGGGRDILAAKLFGQRRVLAVEINAEILRAAHGRFGTFTGGLDREPSVQLVHDEARSFLTRQSERFDVLQLTFIDTFAATAAGAFVLTENVLYTVEGWTVFLNRLKDDGLLSVTRGVSPELHRLVSLARSALLATGAAQPEHHIILLVNNRARRPPSWGNMGLLLVRRQPFPEDEVRQIEQLAERLQFDVWLRPGWASEPILEALASGRGLATLREQAHLNFEAPTDDSPFFFNMLRLRDWPRSWGKDAPGMAHPGAVSVLVNLLIVVSVLTLVCIVLPLCLSARARAAHSTSLTTFFIAIGFGFMFIEISMMQRLTIFLGHPAYGLTVILFVLLLASGLGSYTCRAISNARLPTAGRTRLCLLIGTLVLAGVATPLVGAFAGATTSTRIVLSGSVLAAMGVFMGMAFPIGMRLAARDTSSLTPWLWGINGASSVLASVLAVAIAMAFGISISYWAGTVSYVGALGAFCASARRQQSRP